MAIPPPSPRAAELADLVVQFSLGLGAGDVLLVQHDKEFAPYVPFFDQATAKVGASIVPLAVDYQEERRVIERGDPDEFREVFAHRMSYVDRTTARVRFDPLSDPNYLAGVDEDKNTLFEEIVRGPYSNEICDREIRGVYKWNVLAIPCEADAERANMTYDAYENFVYAATIGVDWSSMKKKIEPLAAAMSGAKDVHILVPGMTDLHLSLEGRGPGVCAGKWNMPDGEFYFGPVEDSANGFITFPYRSTWSGNPFQNIRLKFQDGEAQIAHCTATIGQRELHRILSSPGANRLGELGFGCNPGITYPMDNILWDEKISGTIHGALGDSYKEPLHRGGGLNNSAYHWDLVCEMRKIGNMPGGELRVDGKTIQRNGVWLI